MINTVFLFFGAVVLGFAIAAASIEPGSSVDLRSAELQFSVTRRFEDKEETLKVREKPAIKEKAVATVLLRLLVSDRRGVVVLSK